jgi:uncharacterized BrkB/YihY/UPF0761 family membrane protein
VIGLIAGLASLIWGTTGLAQAGLYTMEQVWNLPGPARPGFLPRLARSLLFLVLLGVLVIATSLLAGLSTYGHQALAFVVLAEAVEAVVNAFMYFVGFRILTPRGVPAKDLVRGAVLAGICWTILQVLGAYLIHHYLHSDSVYGVFATVLGLVAWLYLAAQSSGSPSPSTTARRTTTRAGPRWRARDPRAGLPARPAPRPRAARPGSAGRGAACT